MIHNCYRIASTTLIAQHYLTPAERAPASRLTLVMRIVSFVCGCFAFIQSPYDPGYRPLARQLLRQAWQGKAISRHLPLQHLTEGLVFKILKSSSPYDLIALAESSPRITHLDCSIDPLLLLPSPRFDGRNLIDQQWISRQRKAMRSLRNTFKQITSENRPALIALGLSGQMARNDNELLEYVRHQPQLESIELAAGMDPIELTDQGLVQLAQACPTLKAIDLYRCQSLTQAGLRQFLQASPYLESISLPAPSLCSDTDTRPTLHIFAQSCPGLKRLKIPDRSITITSEGIKAVGQSCPRLSHFCSRSLEIDDEMLEQIANHWPQLEELQLRSEDLLGDRGVSDKGIDFVAQKCKQLTAIDLSGCSKITEQSLISLATHAHGLQKLILDAPITDQGLNALITNKLPLTSLSLRASKSDPVSADRLKEFAQHYPALRELKLIGFEGVTREVIQAFVQHCPQLTRVELIECPNLDDSALAELVGHCEDLRELSLIGSKITDRGVEALVAHLPNLEQLLLDNCTQISDPTVRFLAQNPRDLPNLKTLSVIGSRCTRRGVEVLEVARPHLTIRAIFYEGIPDL